MNQLQPANRIRTLSPVTARPTRHAPGHAPGPAPDRFECASAPPQACGLSWAGLSMATLGVLVQAQIQAPQPQQPLVVAHRGSTEHAVENTLPAFRDALADGAGAIELDVHLTLDRDLVVIHDDTLDRTYGRPGEVRNMTSAQLREIGVPMLSDVLALPGDHQLIVEIKHPKGDHSEGIEQELVDQLQLAGVEDRTIVISFDESSLKELHQIEPELPTGYLYSGRPIDPKQVRDELGIDYLGPHFATVTRTYVRQAHDAGLKVNPWLVNTPRDQKRMIQMNVDAITTDNAGQLVQLLQPTGG